MKKILLLMSTVCSLSALDTFVQPTKATRSIVGAFRKKLKQVEKIKVGLCVVATGRYDVFIEQLYQSMRRYFLDDRCSVRMFVFSDGNVPYHDDLIRIYLPRLDWPYDSMMRFHVYTLYADLLRTMDYLYFCDAELLFVDHVGNEILSDRVAVRHPGFYASPKDDYERSPKSTACITHGEGMYYFTGAFYGGKSEIILNDIQCMAHRVNQDIAQGVTAKWHDESHWNRYCIDYHPSLILSAEYYSGEKGFCTGQPRHKRIISRDKDIHVLRS